MRPDTRTRIARAIASHIRCGHPDAPTPSDYELTDGILAIIAADTPTTPLPSFAASFAECGLSPDAHAQILTATAALAAQLAEPPDPGQSLVELRRRTPAERHRYLTDHRAEAIGRGIPADLVDLMIEEAETTP